MNVRISGSSSTTSTGPGFGSCAGVAGSLLVIAWVSKVPKHPGKRTAHAAGECRSHTANVDPVNVAFLVRCERDRRGAELAGYLRLPNVGTHVVHRLKGA